MARPMMNATTGLALRADGNLAGDGKADAAMTIELGWVDVEADIEAIQRWEWR